MRLSRWNGGNSEKSTPREARRGAREIPPIGQWLRVARPRRRKRSVWGSSDAPASESLIGRENRLLGVEHVEAPSGRHALFRAWAVNVHGGMVCIDACVVGWYDGRWSFLTDTCRNVDFRREAG